MIDCFEPQLVYSSCGFFICFGSLADSMFASTVAPIAWSACVTTTHRQALSSRCAAGRTVGSPAARPRNDPQPWPPPFRIRPSSTFISCKALAAGQQMSGSLQVLWRASGPRRRSANRRDLLTLVCRARTAISYAPARPARWTQPRLQPRQARSYGLACATLRTKPWADFFFTVHAQTELPLWESGSLRLRSCAGR